MAVKSLDPEAVVRFLCLIYNENAGKSNFLKNIFYYCIVSNGLNPALSIVIKRFYLKL